MHQTGFVDHLNGAATRSWRVQSRCRAIAGVFSIATLFGAHSTNAVNATLGGGIRESPKFGYCVVQRTEPTEVHLCERLGIQDQISQIASHHARSKRRVMWSSA